MQISMMINESLITVYTVICRIKLLRHLSDAKHREQVFCDDPAIFFSVFFFFFFFFFFCWKNRTTASFWHYQDRIMVKMYGISSA